MIFLHGSGAEVRWGASRYFADYFARRGIAARSPGVAFVISNAGAAIPMWESEVHSLRTQARAEGVEGESLARADSYIDRMIAVARTGTGWGALHAEWLSARERNAPWAALLEPPRRDFCFWSFFQAIADYNAADHWRKVTVPVLIVQAGRDGLVPVERSVAAMRLALREAGNPDYTFVTLPGVPHNFVIQPAPENGLKWPVLAPGYADLVTAWIRFRMTPARGANQ